ncbi:MAG: EAL domain-containing protein [Rhodanobacter sp.]
MPLGYGLLAMVGLILSLTWVALQLQVALGGFLNGESVWSKAQKQAVVDLTTYAGTGRASDLERFSRNYNLLNADRWARDAIAANQYDYDEVVSALRRSDAIPTAIPGVIFILRNFSAAPHMRDALMAWRSVDASIDELGAISLELQQEYANGPLSSGQVTSLRERINKINDFIEPRSKVFSLQVAAGSVWLGRVLFAGVLSAACIATLLWLVMARRILASIRGSEERYRLLFDSAADAIVMVDEGSGRILDANRKALAWTGRSGQDLLGDRFSHLFQHPVPRKVGVAAANGLLDAAGEKRPVEMQSSLATWGNRPVRQAIIRDVSERVAMESERRVAAQALASIVEGVLIADADRRVISANGAQFRITGMPIEALQGKPLDQHRTLPDGKPLPASIWVDVAAGHNWVGEVRSSRHDGSTYPEQLSISAIRDADNQVQYFVAVFTNIYASKAHQRHLEYLARHDPLTGLVNRAEFERCCADAIAEAVAERGAAVVLFIDLDAFKIVNDSYSHAVGDRLLIKVAERIKRQLSVDDLAGRIGGDEFTILVRRIGMREDARSLANRLLATLSEPLHVDDCEVVLSASIGIAGYPLDGADPATLIANADAAMYTAKTEERNALRFYTPMMHAQARKRLQLATELRQALAREEFHLVYQPSVEMSTGRIVAVEALLRWQHPTRGEVMPADFIPVAESLGLIRRIDEWVMHAACAQIQAWDRAGVSPIRVAINISARWFGHPAFVERVTRALQSMQVPSARLLLEITESAMLHLGDEVLRTMQTLEELGIGVAVDDFGTGYSSMSYLKLPAVAHLKIDRSFVVGLPDNANDVAIARAMLAMAQSLGLSTIAEGIETEAQHDFLLQAGCMEGQGYLYAYPLAPVEIERMLCRNYAHAPAKLRLVPPKRN